MTARLKFPLYAAGAFGLAFCLALPATAQLQKTPVGTINAMIDDAAYRGETLDIPSEGTSTAEFRALGPMTSVSIQAHDPEAESIMRNVLNIEVMLMGTDASASIMESSVSYWPDGMSEPFFISEESGVETEVVFDAISLGEGAAASGSFSALMCKKQDFFSETDLNDCLPVEGTFDTALRSAD